MRDLTFALLALAGRGLGIDWGLARRSGTTSAFATTELVLDNSPRVPRVLRRLEVRNARDLLPISLDRDGQSKRPLSQREWLLAGPDIPQLS